jgi:hypothetical protein
MSLKLFFRKAVDGLEISPHAMILHEVFDIFDVLAVACAVVLDEALHVFELELQKRPLIAIAVFRHAVVLKHFIWHFNILVVVSQTKIDGM